MQVGLIGTGLMGLPMAERLLEAGVSVVAYNRTSARLEPLRPAGARLVASAAEVLQQSQAVILMLSDAQAIRDVLLADDSRADLADCTIIQMGTIAPSESRQLHDAIAAAGGDYLEAPVLGSIPQVKEGKLQVMVGATPAQFQQWSPLLKHFGEELLLVGEVGSAAALKLALNQLIVSLTNAFAMSVGFVQHQGVAIETFMGVLRQSALYAPTFDKKLQRMVERNFTNPNFPVKHLLKDTNLFIEEAIASNIRVDALTGVRQILETACASGLAEEDYSALFAAVVPPFAESTKHTEIQIEHHPNPETLERLGVLSWEIWTKDASEFPWTYDETETCYFLEGAVIVTPEQGEPVSMGKGDLVTFPAGMTCTWTILEEVKKHYQFS